MEPQTEIVGLAETLRVFNQLPKEANKALRERTQQLTGTLAAQVQAAGRGSDAQSAAVVASVKAKKDRVPSLVAGGAKRITSSRTPTHQIFFGAEFGANRLPQFRPHKGREGYWLYPTVREHTSDTARVWQQVLDDVADEWTRGQAGVN